VPAISIAVVVGLALAANGTFMLVAPSAWYGLVPGVAATGPLNAHFVRDIGAAYLVSGAAFAWFGRDARTRMAALAGAAFLVLHALVHVGEAVGHHALVTWADLLAVVLPAALAAWLTLFPTRTTEMTMLQWLMRRRIAAFERATGYDASYVRDILDADMGAFLKFSMLNGMAQHRRNVPLAAWYAASFAAVLAEDCGPCTQLGVTFAERDGLAPELIAAMLAGDLRALPDDAVLGLRFARAVLAHDAGADELREEILARWGSRGLVSLAFAITSARLFPTVKYALGHGQACRRITVGGNVVATPRRAA